MKVFIVYCHPSEDSFTKNMCDSFIKGVTDSGNEYIISDAEQEKINSSDAIAFIYPVFWTEAPAKLVGWFDRVWSYGFAYGNKTMKMLEKGLILCSAGNPADRLEKLGLLGSMKKVMFGDRLFNRVKQTEFVVFDSTSRENEARETNWHSNLKKAYEKGKTLFSPSEKVFSLEQVPEAHRWLEQSCGYGKCVVVI